MFGAGEADAFAAVTAAVAAPSVPIAAVSGAPASEKTPAPDNASVSRALNEPPKDSVPSLSSEKSASSGKSAANEADRPAAQ